MRLLRLAVRVFFGISISSISFGSCDRWITGQDAGGYCTDYIEIATSGYRQTGDASDWTSNVSSANIQPGDVAIFDSGSFGHVAYIEEVHRNSSGVPTTIDVSEYNWGGYSGKTPEEVACAVTTNYGVQTTRDGISVSSVTRFWHPPYANETDPATIPGNQFTVRKVGNYAWYPFDTSCIKAQAWYGLDSNRQIVRTYAWPVCSDIFQVHYPDDVSYDALFGAGNMCIK